ncbi:MAG: recombination mediator RecR [Actinobacteria bacterium]|nr:recombination protein RecR [Acidimicrobiia bacterium]MCA1734955.1 recombination mediator RecR [Actinomycetota bacterium]
MFEGPLQRLIDELSRLPGVGKKSAQRMAFHLLGVEKADALRLSTAIADMREQLGICQRCFNVTAGEECSICRDLKREVTLLCVVERAQDIAVIERSQEFRGRYHVLGGAISPIGGVGPSQLHIAELGKRVIDEKIEELILATNPTVEGDVTAMYIAREMKPLGVRVTRLAMGLPVGGDLDYADELTLGRALTGRLEL